MNKRYETRKVVTVTGRCEEKNDMLDYCYRNGYRPRFMGPRGNGRYKVIAERVEK